jgi:hypothetical protein
VKRRTWLVRHARTCVAGLLTSSKLMGSFLSHAQRHTQKVLFQVEPLFAAATFGLTGLDEAVDDGNENYTIVAGEFDS